MAKQAVVISGGGSKGAFAVGVLKCLYEKHPGFPIDLVAGTSTGSLIAPMLVTGDIAKLEEIYTTVKTKDIISEMLGAAKAFKQGYLYDTDGRLEEMVRKHLTTRANVIFSSHIQAFFTTVCLQTGRIVYFQTGNSPGTVPVDSDLIHVSNLEDLISAVVASCNQPVLMPPIWHDPKVKKEYVDGGLREYAPIQIAIENGATDILVIVLNPTHDKRTEISGFMKDLPTILKRAISLLIEEVGESDIRFAQFHDAVSQYLKEIEENAKSDFRLSDTELQTLFKGANPIKTSERVSIKVIRPRFEMEIAFKTSGLEFDPKKMKQMLDHGYQVAQLEIP